MRYLYENDAKGVNRFLSLATGVPIGDGEYLKTMFELAFAYVRLRRRVASPEPGFRQKLRDIEHTLALKLQR